MVHERAGYTPGEYTQRGTAQAKWRDGHVVPAQGAGRTRHGSARNARRDAAPLAAADGEDARGGRGRPAGAQLFAGVLVAGSIPAPARRRCGGDDAAELIPENGWHHAEKHYPRSDRAAEK